MTFLVNAILAFATMLSKKTRGGTALRLALLTRPGRYVALAVARNVSAVQRRPIIEAVQKLNPLPAKKAFADSAAKAHERRPESVTRLECLALALVYSDYPPRAWPVLVNAVKRAAQAGSDESSLAAIAANLAFDLARYRSAVEMARVGIRLAPLSLHPRYDYLKAAFSAGKLRLEREAIELFGRQWGLVPDWNEQATEQDIEKVIRTFAMQTIHTIAPYFQYDKLRLGKDPRVAVFFLSSTQALGHAVLDPFHFIALNRGKFDRLVFIGPTRDSYRPASRACLQIVEQYGDYIETGSDILMNLSWMSLGHHQLGPVRFIVDHYWALLRQAVHRTRDADDPFLHNQWHFTLPQKYGVVGEKFCRKAGIRLDRPLVVMHVRDSGYHDLAKQSYRDSGIENYRAAIEHLLIRGFQVVRIGDNKMKRLDLRKRERYFELPFIKDYQHELDAFLISRSDFMIGCQSGPCAFARALGVPLLSVNAVLHYTLLPAKREMACFKRYFRKRDGSKQEMSLEEALETRMFHFENSYQFAEAGITLEDVSAEEIRSSVEDMIAWIADPTLPETDLQKRFAAAVEAAARRLEQDSDSLELPIADYLGICLPGYRIAPTVAARREPKATSLHLIDAGGDGIESSRSGSHRAREPIRTIRATVMGASLGGPSQD